MEVFKHSSVSCCTLHSICVLCWSCMFPCMAKRNVAPMEIQCSAKASHNIYSITIAVLLKLLNSKRHVSGTTEFLVSWRKAFTLPPNLWAHGIDSSLEILYVCWVFFPQGESLITAHFLPYLYFIIYSLSWISYTSVTNKLRLVYLGPYSVNTENYFLAG